MPPFTFLEDIEDQVAVPDSGLVSRTLFADDTVKVVGFGFSAGHELPAHTAPMAVMLYFVRGEAELTLASGIETEKRHVHAGAFVHLPPQTPHSIFASTPLVMLLLMLKQVR